jgi:hypothetical protein
MQRAIGWAARVQFPAGTRDFSLFHGVQNDSGRPPSLLSNGSRGIFSAGKAVGAEADRTPLSSAEVNNGGAIPPLLHTSSWRGA